LAESQGGRFGGTNVAPLRTDDEYGAARGRKSISIVRFNRKELGLLLNVYGKKVATGDWRDYAMDFLADRAVFSIYRRTSERPQFMVEKNPKSRNRQGQFAVINAEGRILKRGQDLSRVLRVLDPDLVLVR